MPYIHNSKKQIWRLYSSPHYQQAIITIQRFFFKKEKRIIYRYNVIMENLIDAIKKLKQEKNALILGHYYQKGEI